MRHLFERLIEKSRVKGDNKLFGKRNKINNVILFLSSYIPLYMIIIIQNSSSLISKVQAMISNKEFIVKRLLECTEVYVVVFCFLLTVTLLILLIRMIRNTEFKNNTNGTSIKVIELKDNNHNYITSYIAVYILPFITLNLTTLTGILQFLVLFYFIGFIYLKYTMIFINPILNIIFKINIYDAVLEDDNGNVKDDCILLSANNKKRLENKKIKVIIDDRLFFELKPN